MRLRQEYFFVSASLQDLVRRHTRTFGSIYALPERAAIQLNDTHPSIAIAELMRILVDLHNVPWDEAWRITVETFSYTNHTLLPEALESWPVPLFERLLPRHLEIIYAINAHHLDAARRTGPLDPDLLTEISLIDESDGRRVRMGHLAFVGSHRVNGVSALHTELMRTSVFSHLHRLYPDRIVNKTNGISFRRWLHQANPGLTRLLCEVCGPAVLDNPAALEPSRRPGRRRSAAGTSRRGQARQQNDCSPVLSGSVLGCTSTRARCSMCRSSAFTSISASCSIYWTRSPDIVRSWQIPAPTGSRASKYFPERQPRATLVPS